MRLPAVPVYLGLAAASAAFFAGFSTLSGLYRIQAAGLDPFQLVLVGTVLELSVFLFEIPTGVVADVYSRRLSLVIGCALIGLGFAVEATNPSFGPILLAQVVWGVGYTFTSGARTAWIVDELGGEGMGQVFLRGNQLAQLGSLVGIGAAVGLGRQGLHLPLLAAGIGFVALALTLAVVMPERGFTRRPREERQRWGDLGTTFVQGLGVVRSRPSLAWLLLAALLVGASSEPLDRLWELHLLDNAGLARSGIDPVLAFGAITAVSRLLGIGGAEYVRRRVDIESPRRAVRALRWMNGALVVAIVGFALAQSLLLALVCYWALSVLRIVEGPVLSTWTNQRIPSEVRATVLSMFGQGDSLGQFVGGPALGALGRSAGLRAAFLATAAFLVPVQAVYLRLRSDPPPGR